MQPLSAKSDKRWARSRQMKRQRLKALNEIGGGMKGDEGKDRVEQGGLVKAW
ncbi:hypothetical protein GYH30_043559 [Glycine max]|nr:hypothetical protein GYH30_043559 [Glycine max]